MYSEAFVHIYKYIHQHTGKDTQTYGYTFSLYNVCMYLPKPSAANGLNSKFPSSKTR